MVKTVFLRGLSEINNEKYENIKCLLKLLKFDLKNNHSLLKKGPKTFKLFNSPLFSFPKEIGNPSSSSSFLFRV